MPYADADFFIAMSDTNDRLNAGAVSVYNRYRGSITTSLATVVELALVSVKRGRKVGKLLASIVTLSDLYDAYWDKVMMAAQLIDDKGVGVLDAFHAAMCGGEIISSDHIYDGLGIKRIGLE